MSILSRLFGGKRSSSGFEPVVYKGFAIVPEPLSEGSRYRVAAQIEKEVGGKAIRLFLHSLRMAAEET